MTAVDLRYWSHRAEREAVAAAGAPDGKIAAIHAELSRLYATQVIRALGRSAARVATPA